MGRDDDRDRRSSDRASEAGTLIVWIETASEAEVEDVKGALLDIADAVQRHDSDRHWTALKVEGAAQQAIRSRMQPFGFDWSVARPDVYEQAVLLLLITRLAQASAASLTSQDGAVQQPLTPPGRNRVELPPGDRQSLVDALLGAFPSYDTLVFVFDYHIGDRPDINVKAWPDNRGLYGHVIARMESEGRLDEFVCGAARRNLGNRDLSALVATTLRRCVSCGGVQRNPTSCPRIGG